MGSSPANGTCVIVSMSLGNTSLSEFGDGMWEAMARHSQEGLGEAIVDEVHRVGVDARHAHEEVLRLDVAVHKAVLVEHLQAPQLSQEKHEARASLGVCGV